MIAKGDVFTNSLENNCNFKNRDGLFELLIKSFPRLQAVMLIFQKRPQ